MKRRHLCPMDSTERSLPDMQEVAHVIAYDSFFWIFYVVGYARACCAWEGKVKVYTTMLGGSDLICMIW